MKHITLFVGLLIATFAVSAQEPDTTILEIRKLIDQTGKTFEIKPN
ncbi:MAG: hypothetical protein KF852_17660 [Saprospiraceae bacterium]|nr:hypothetical protein [Saprospiraceae bacterium]